MVMLRLLHVCVQTVIGLRLFNILKSNTMKTDMYLIYGLSVIALYLRPLSYNFPLVKNSITDTKH
eukprot:UN08999